MTDGTATPPVEEEAAVVQVRTWKLNVKSELRRPFRKLFIVGLDGSDLSFQAVRFASQLADEYRDNVLIITLTKSDDDDATFQRSEATAKQIAMHYGTPHMRISSEAIRIPEDWSYADGLVYLANHTEK